MALTTLLHEPPLRRRVDEPSPDFEPLERAEVLAREGAALEAIDQVLLHFFPGRQPTDLRTEPFVFAQGTCHVRVRLDADDLLVQMPLVRLPQGGRAIAAMRYLLERTSASGQLYQPRLHGDEVLLEYRDPLARFHPAKLLEVLRKASFEADRTDDWLVSQFGAEPLEPAAVEPLADDERARAWRLWQLHWEEIDELLKEAQRRRSVFFLNELTAYTHYRLLLALPLYGKLGQRLDEAASTFNDTSHDPSEREASLRKFVREARAVSEEELLASLGHAQFALSPLGRGNGRLLKHNLGEGQYMSTVESLRNSERSLDAALALTSTFTFLLARFSWPLELEQLLLSALERASGKPFREQAKILFDAGRAAVEAFKDDEDEDEEHDDEDEEHDHDHSACDHDHSEVSA